MLDLVTNPACPEDLRLRWIVSHVVLVRPRIDVRRFRRAVDKVSIRHDSLRTRFDRVGDVWRAHIDPPGRDMIREIDLGDLEDGAFHAALSGLVNAPMEVVDAPLAEMIIAKCGSRGDALVTRVHHTITDGYGMIVLIEDLLKYLIGLPVLGDAVSFGEYVTRYQSSLPSKVAETDAFWRGMHRDFPKAPHVGRKAKGLPPLFDCMGEIEQRMIEFRAPPDSIARLKAQAVSAKLGLNTFFMAGHLEALCHQYGMDRVMFMTHVARSNPALRTYMGDHTLDPVLLHKQCGKKDIVPATRYLNALMHDAMAHLPSDFARRGTDYEADLIETGCYPSQFSIHNPRASVREKQSVFSQGLKAKFGEEQRLGPFAVTSLNVPRVSRILAELQLVLGNDDIPAGFHIAYDGMAFTTEEIQQLGETCFDLLGLDLVEVDTA